MERAIQKRCSVREHLFSLQDHLQESVFLWSNRHHEERIIRESYERYEHEAEEDV